MMANDDLDPSDAVELPETGWGALVAWIAGPSWVHPDRLRVLPQVRRTVEVDGSAVTTSTDRSSQDLDAMDEDIAAYLADAGVPPPPRGVRWSLRRPRDMRDADLWAHLHSSMAQRCPRAREPRDIHDCLTPIVRGLLDLEG